MFCKHLVDLIIFIESLIASCMHDTVWYEVVCYFVLGSLESRKLMFALFHFMNSWPLHLTTVTFVSISCLLHLSTIRLKTLSMLQSYQWRDYSSSSSSVPHVKPSPLCISKASCGNNMTFDMTTIPVLNISNPITIWTSIISQPGDFLSHHLQLYNSENSKPNLKSSWMTWFIFIY